MGNKEVGALGEKIACDFLSNEGYEILERNVRFSRFSEIDIIAKTADTLVFVEVKTRKSSACGAPCEAITAQKYANIKKGVYSFLQNCPYKYRKFRIDAVSVLLYPKLTVEHLRNI